MALPDQQGRRARMALPDQQGQRARMALPDQQERPARTVLPDQQDQRALTALPDLLGQQVQSARMALPVQLDRQVMYRRFKLFLLQIAIFIFRPQIWTCPLQLQFLRGISPMIMEITLPNFPD
ncbi:hypothetical protein A7K91_01990 [Paenibacillus oryzae]|uniref:Uncharacterized protein n=1 Tax=Paenibacillus oryzae TaxID=1844972 RepID=A0A1A5Y9V7_9BACL|nr:hypothetical protein A7K91_01990 [Paenibacillus oryzae]